MTLPRLVKTVVGLDTGDHNGFCLLNVYKVTGDLLPPEMRTHLYIRGFAVQLLGMGTWEGDDEFIDGLSNVLWTMSVADAPAVAVCERFIFTRNSQFGDARAVLEMVGATKTLIKILTPNVTFDNSQKAGEAKSLVDDDKLRELGLKKRGDKQLDHAHDAARHAILYVAKMRNKQR